MKITKIFLKKIELEKDANIFDKKILIPLIKKLILPKVGITKKKKLKTLILIIIKKMTTKNIIIKKRIVTIIFIK